MPSMIYTKNSSGAIRRLRRKKPTKSYLSALLGHIRFLRGLGFKVDSKGKMKSRYKKWPSAYASGALVKCRKVGAANWGNKSK